MDQKRIGQGTTYHIRVKGKLAYSAKDWFGNLSIIPLENGDTLLVGVFVDQSALRGFLDQLWNLNFTIISLEKSENENDQNPNL